MMSKKQNPIQILAEALAADCSSASVSIDQPAKANGVWFLDISNDGHHVQVQWQAKHGFGVSSSTSVHYGEGPDEVYNNAEAVRHRVLSLLLSRGETSSPPAVRLAELRQELGLSQIQVAELLNIQQGAISRMERRGDIKISSLREYCKSLGGSLALMAKFPNGSTREIQLDDEQGTNSTLSEVSQ